MKSSNLYNKMLYKEEFSFPVNGVGMFFFALEINIIDEWIMKKVLHLKFYKKKLFEWNQRKCF